MPGPTTSLAVDLIQRGRYQPRRNFDEDRLRELADSISAQGMVQPIVVRPVGTTATRSSPASAAGGRQMAGLADVPVVVRDVDDQSAMAMALIENIQRDDLNPLEEATALHRLLSEFELTHQQVAAGGGQVAHHGHQPDPVARTPTARSGTCSTGARSRWATPVRCWP